MDKETQLYIINVLRRGTITWSRRTECLNRGRWKKVIGKFKNGNDETIWVNDCEMCGVVHDQKDELFEIDHVVEISSFTGDWNAFIPRMYCALSNLQRLCIPCHKKKTSGFNATLNFQRKEIRSSKSPAKPDKGHLL